MFLRVALQTRDSSRRVADLLEPTANRQPRVRSLHGHVLTVNLMFITPVLFIYDTFVTFDREVTCFWTGQWTGAPLLFFANKWVSIVYYAMTFAQLAHLSSDKVSELCRFVLRRHLT